MTNMDMEKKMRAGQRCVLLRIVQSKRQYDDGDNGPVPTGYTLVPDNLVDLAIGALYWDINAELDERDGGNRVQETIAGINAMIANDKEPDALAESSAASETHDTAGSDPRPCVLEDE